MKRILSFVACLVALVGCKKVIATENVIAPAKQDVVETTIDAEPLFTLDASYGSPDTKLSFDSDGLNTTWQPGDKLYIIDPTGTNSTVEMTTDITGASKSARFTSTTAVLPGEYVVVYGARRRTDNSVSLNLGSNQELSNRIVLTAPLTIQNGQTYASIALKHAFAKLTFTFKNLPGELSNSSFGMAAAKGLQTSSRASFTKEGWSAPYSPKLVFADGTFYQSDGYKASVLIAPSDLSGDKVYFYLAGESSGCIVSYEIVKNGIELKAGVNYNVYLDFSSADVNIVPFNYGYELTQPADFRTVLYGGSFSFGMNYNRIYLLNDIDFKNDTYLPIQTNGETTFYGNSHTLKNVTIKMANCDFVGLISYGTVDKVIVKNGDIKGRSYVGGIVGYGDATECGFEGNIETIGDYVGGIVGYCDMNNVSKCYHVGNVIGNNYVGGVTGNLSSSYSTYYTSSSYSIGNVTGSGVYVGGVNGYGHARYSYSYGTVSSGKGITGNGSASYCLTSAATLNGSSSNSQYTNYGPSKTFVSSLSVINTEEAYSTQTWANIDAGCPLLRWQADTFGGEIIAPGFGNQDW